MEHEKEEVEVSVVVGFVVAVVVAIVIDRVAVTQLVVVVHLCRLLLVDALVAVF